MHFYSGVPLAGGVLSALARKRGEMEAINLAAFGLTFLLSVAVAAGVLRSGAISLWDGFLYADSLSALVILLSASVALVCAVYAVGYLREDERSGALDEESGSRESLAKLRKYYALTPLFVFSMLLVTVANNLGVMWAAIELTTLASVFLITFYGKVTSHRGCLEIRHYRRRRSFHGAVRHDRHVLRRPQAAGERGTVRFELVGAGGPGGASGQNQHANGVCPGAARLRHEGGPRADAHLEAGRLQ